MMTDREIVEVVQAHIDGKEIQAGHRPTNSWHELLEANPLWQFNDCDYRVKPEPRSIWVNAYKFDSKELDPFLTEAEALEGKCPHWDTIEFVEVIKDER